jgi:ParB-like chromosome segregation protein Spo0J
MTEAEKRAYIITDNKTALNAGWNEELLKIELGELAEMDFDLEITGFSEQEIDDIFAEPNALDLDETPKQDEDKSAMSCHCPKCGFIFEVKP